MWKPAGIWQRGGKPGVEKRRAGIAIQGEFGYNGKKKMADYNQTAKKVPEAEQLAPVGVQRYGRARVAMEVRILAKQA